ITTWSPNNDKTNQTTIRWDKASCSDPAKIPQAGSSIAKNRAHQPRDKDSPFLPICSLQIYNLSLQILSFSFLLTISRPPRGYVETKKVLHTLRKKVVVLLAPGVGFEPTRPEGAQADRRAYSRHGPAC